MQKLKIIQKSFSHVFGNLLFAMVVTVIWMGCAKTENFSHSAINAPLALTASDSAGASSSSLTLALNQANQYNTVLTFKWTTGTNHQSDNSITYILQIAKQGSNFANALSNNMGKATYTSNFTAGALNTLLLTYWSDTTGAPLNLEARIYTIIGDGLTTKGDSSAPVQLILTPYKPVSKTLYIVGTATANGLVANTADSLTPDPAVPGLFHYTGLLTQGQFEFITSTDSLLPSYSQGADTTHIIYNTSASSPVTMFTVSTNKVYTISVNLISLTISITPAAVPLYSQLWIVGAATPNGWNIDAPNQMVVDPFNAYVFHYNQILVAGEFKIPTGLGNWNGDYYRPLTSDPPITDTTAALVLGNTNPPDNKWNISIPGAYKITLNTQYNSIHIDPFTPFTQLWMVGDATPNGWNINAPTPMVPTTGDPYTFTYTGPLTVGEFKIPTTLGNFNCNYFRPDMNHPPITDTLAPYVPINSYPADVNDFKWYISIAGNYIVTFNQLYETIYIRQQ